MALPWIRLDTQMHGNPKIIDLVDRKLWRAAFVYIASLSYAGHHGTAGFIPRGALPLIHATPTEARHLVSSGLWRASGSGWQIHDFEEFQLVDEGSVKRRDKARRAAEARWSHTD